MNLMTDDEYFGLKYFWVRIKQLVVTLFDLGLCYGVVFVASQMTHSYFYI